MTRQRVMPAIAAVACGAIAAGLGFAAQGLLRERRSLPVQGVRRTYALHIPRGASRERPMPLVLVFHGGGGTGAQIARHTRFSELADREGFVVAYPDGLNRSWNDGREAKPGSKSTEGDDVAFVSAMIDAIGREVPIDRRRVFATGISNGACFCNYLASRLSDRIAAIAPVAGSIGVGFESRFRPAHAVSVLMINGTADPLIRYGGGDVVGGRRGAVIPVERTARHWLDADGIHGEPIAGALPDKDPSDGCRVDWRKWSRGKANTEVWLYKIEGGGHTWPGATQYLPRAVIGNLCRDFDATDEIWQFFRTHPMKR